MPMSMMNPQTISQMMSTPQMAAATPAMQGINPALLQSGAFQGILDPNVGSMPAIANGFGNLPLLNNPSNSANGGMGLDPQQAYAMAQLSQPDNRPLSPAGAIVGNSPVNIARIAGQHPNYARPSLAAILGG